jgi:hypothetical protein
MKKLYTVRFQQKFWKRKNKKAILVRGSKKEGRRHEQEEHRGFLPQ